MRNWVLKEYSEKSSKVHRITTKEDKEQNDNNRS